MGAAQWQRLLTCVASGDYGGGGAGVGGLRGFGGTAKADLRSGMHGSVCRVACVRVQGWCDRQPATESAALHSFRLRVTRMLLKKAGGTVTY